jgi:hypothetical protein
VAVDGLRDRRRATELTVARWFDTYQHWVDGYRAPYEVPYIYD